MIYVTLGTMFLDFDRLVRKMDAIAAATDEHVIIQLGLSKSYPAHCEHFDFKPRPEVLALQSKARVVVSHGGVSVLDALQVGRPLIVVPRLKKYNEHLNDHQLDIAERIHARGWGRMILDVDELDEACASPPPPPPPHYRPAKHRIEGAVAEAIERVAANRAQGRSPWPAKRGSRQS